MTASRLLPGDQRGPLRAAPTTSTSWVLHNRLRRVANRHHRRWLVPALFCAPPVGVAMLWLATPRPGTPRRWVTAGAGVWTVVLLALVLVVVPRVSAADAGGVPPRLAAGAVPATTTSVATPSSGLGVPGTPAPTATPGTATPAAPPATSAGSSATAAPTAGSGAGAATAAAPDADGAPATAPTTAGGPVTAPTTRSAAPAPTTPSTRPTPAGSTPTPPAPRPTEPPTKPAPRPTPKPPAPTPPKPKPTPQPPVVPVAAPFDRCDALGASAVTIINTPLRCVRTAFAGLRWWPQ